MLSCFIVVFWGPEPTPPKDKKITPFPQQAAEIRRASQTLQFLRLPLCHAFPELGRRDH